MRSVMKSKSKIFLILISIAVTLALASSVEKKKSLAAKFITKNAQNPKASSQRELVKVGKTVSGGNLEGRQYGGYSSYGSGGGYDIYTLIAVSAFAALFGALFFELATGGTLRSINSPTIQLPFGLSIDSELISQIMSSMGDAISNNFDGKFFEDVLKAADTASTGEGKSRTLRDVGGQIGVSKWINAYRKDPIEYQCVRKVACETLADSTIVAKSMKSPFGSIVLSTVGLFIENGHELQSIVKDTVGNPEKCMDMAPWGFCNDDED